MLSENLFKINYTKSEEILANEYKINENYHNIKSSLFVISGYIELGEYEKAKSKIQEICNAMIITNSQNPILDSFISSKIDRARASNIIFNLPNTSIPKINIDEYDICVAVGNALDNAIEACQKIKDTSKRYIEMSMVKKNSYFNILITNSVAEKVEINENHVKTSKKEKNIHGFGLKSINNIVQKHNGSILISQGENTFSVNIQLKIG